MDWGRAKVILIFSFFILNLLLGYSLYLSKWNLSTSSFDNAINVEETLKILRNKNIQIQTPIPKDTPLLGEISVKFDEHVQHRELTVVKNQVNINAIIQEKDKEKTAQLAITNFKQYQYDPIISNQFQYYFHQIYDTLPMFDVNLELLSQKEKIVAYKQAYVQVQSVSDQKKQNVISAYTAIRTLVQNYLAFGTTITNIQLGYHGQIYNSETQYMLPSWRITVSGGSIYYVHAFNGDVEVPQNNGK